MLFSPLPKPPPAAARPSVTALGRAYPRLVLGRDTAAPRFSRELAPTLPGPKGLAQMAPLALAQADILLPGGAARRIDAGSTWRTRPSPTKLLGK